MVDVPPELALPLDVTVSAPEVLRSGYTQPDRSSGPNTENSVEMASICTLTETPYLAIIGIRLAYASPRPDISGALA